MIDKIQNLNSPLFIENIELSETSLKENSRFHLLIYKIFKEEITPILYKLLKMEEGTLPNVFYENSITLIPKFNKDYKTN